VSANCPVHQCWTTVHMIVGSNPTSDLNMCHAVFAKLSNVPLQVSFRRQHYNGYLAFSFLCTFIPGSEKSIERTFAPVELYFRSLNICSWGAKSPRTCAPCNFRTPGTFAPQTTFVPFNFRSCGTFAPVRKKIVKSRKAMFV